jgi:hypothetical protein
VNFSQPLPQTNISYQFVNTGVKETVSLVSADAPSSYTWSLDPSAGLTASLTPAGALQFASGDGAVVMSVTVPTIEDAGNIVGPAPALSLSTDGKTMSLSLAPDASWLADPSRVWPVAVDPSVSLNIPQSGSECMLLAGAPNTPECQFATSNYIGYNGFTGDAHSMFRFDNLASVVPYDSLIQNAYFDVYENGATSGTSINIALGTVANKPWNPTTATWNDYDSGTSSAWANAGGDFSSTTGPGTPGTPETTLVGAGTANGWLEWDPVRQVQAWVNGEDLSTIGNPAAPNEGFMLTSTNGAAPIPSQSPTGCLRRLPSGLTWACSTRHAWAQPHLSMC